MQMTLVLFVSINAITYTGQEERIDHLKLAKFLRRVKPLCFMDSQGKNLVTEIMLVMDIDHRIKWQTQTVVIQYFVFIAPVYSIYTVQFTLSHHVPCIDQMTGHFDSSRSINKTNATIKINNVNTTVIISGCTNYVGPIFVTPSTLWQEISSFELPEQITRKCNCRNASTY